ncbi:putative RNA-directed DNA polymerase [Helianthus annuus]|nr:putative RNA-directed DNA polymerase [Helianthus annuus]
MNGKLYFKIIESEGRVMATVSTAKASVLVNGSPTQEFPCYRGLRQGDPLSPFLFIIAMEALSGVIKKACIEGLFHGIRCTPHGPLLSHFFFADDAVFVGEWSGTNAVNLNRIMRCFHLASGLRINLAKSKVFGVGVNDTQLQNLASILKCQVGSLPFKHLGLQIGANMHLVKHWKPGVDTFKNRLLVWKSNTLSYGGRITLIKSVLNSLPTRYFSLFKASSQVLRELERLRRDFLWGMTADQQKISWVAWESMILPKEKGGIGIGSLKDANIALLAKWWWRFKVDKNSIWRKVIWSFHNNARSWSFIPVKVSVPGIWKQVAKIELDLSSIGIDLVGLFKSKFVRGSETAFWMEAWTSDEPFRSKFPALYALERSKRVMVADRIKMENGTNTFSFCWTRTPQSAAELNEMGGFMAAMNSAVISVGDDCWSWHLDAAGVFTTQSLKQLIQQGRGSGSSRPFCWNNWTPLKVNFLAWRLWKDRLPTRVSLARRHVAVESTLCSLGDEVDETSDHIFAACPFVHEVWDCLLQWCRIPRCIFFEAKDILDLHVHLRGSTRWKKVVYAVLQTTIWCIWRARNELIFNRRLKRIEWLRRQKSCLFCGFGIERKDRGLTRKIGTTLAYLVWKSNCICIMWCLYVFWWL